MSKFSQRSKDNLKGVHPDLVKVLEAAIKDTPHDFTITEGVRTTAEQKALYSIGRRGIKGEKKVTDKDGVHKKSDHQVRADGYGWAVDLYPYYNGSVQVLDRGVVPALAAIALHIKKTAKRLGVKIIWGGDWKMRDLPHFEL